MDYVVREVADLPEPRPYLLLLGQQEAESPEIIKLGKSLLGEKNFQVRTVNQHEVADYYKVANAFVLASLNEGFGRVFLEAMSHGLPCLTHDYEISRYILGEDGYLADLSVRGSLANLLLRVLAENGSEAKRRLRHQRVYERFSWENLRSSYVDMLWRCQSTENTQRSI
jgi:glycosyltransferase involved in cell wall biosynthesis